MKPKKLAAEQLLELIAEAAEEKQAVNLKVLDVRKTSKMVDFIIIAGAESGPQLGALEKEIDKRLRLHKIKGFRWQGLARSGWIVLDLGAIVVHLMATEQREYYNLEELWGDKAIVYHY